MKKEKIIIMEFINQCMIIINLKMTLLVKKEFKRILLK